ncbi:MAG TPA: MlaD family protein [Candidatus Saccharimonadales bacterium]|nr:MlaD family protein [Candidatus Saccharimonadales bacterium]
MNKKISPTLIGAFVVGAVALLVIAIIAFGSGQLFRESKEFVLYFDGTVNGLHVGAPVKFKGVEIGSVKDILLQMDSDTQVNKIPVIIEIDLKKLTARGASGVIVEKQEAFQKAVVEQSLRAQLRTESMVTGVLYVSFDFFPGAPLTLVQKANTQHRYQEIPTTPTDLQQIQDAATRIVAKFEEVDFKGIITSLTKTVEGVDRLVNSPDLKSALRGLDQTMPKVDRAISDISKLTTNLDGSIDRLSTNMAQTSEAARKAMDQATVAMKQTDAALQAAEGVMTNINGVMDQDSPTFYELRKSLREVSAAARTLRLLSAYIERNPRALIFGKPENTEAR